MFHYYDFLFWIVRLEAALDFFRLTLSIGTVIERKLCRYHVWFVSIVYNNYFIFMHQKNMDSHISFWLWSGAPLGFLWYSNMQMLMIHQRANHDHCDHCDVFLAGGQTGAIQYPAWGAFWLKQIHWVTGGPTCVQPTGVGFPGPNQWYCVFAWESLWF